MNATALRSLKRLTLNRALPRQGLANRCFEFQKRSQLIIRMHNVTLFRRRDARQQQRLFARGWDLPGLAH